MIGSWLWLSSLTLKTIIYSVSLKTKVAWLLISHWLTGRCTGQRLLAHHAIFVRKAPFYNGLYLVRLEPKCNVLQLYFNFWFHSLAYFTILMLLQYLKLWTSSLIFLLLNHRVVATVALLQLFEWDGLVSFFCYRLYNLWLTSVCSQIAFALMFLTFSTKLMVHSIYWCESQLVGD